jgi:RNA polymerase sigma factor for flagellar operon FliA
MTPAEQAYRSSDDDVERRNELVMAELQQVYYCAKRIRERLPKHVDLEDLVQAGMVGLIEASNKFDPTNDAQFSTFASFRIRGAILDSLRKLDWGPRALRRKGREISASRSRITSELGRQATTDEVAADLSISIEEFHSTVGQLDGLVVLGSSVETSDELGADFDLIESAPDKTGNDPLELCLRGENRALLASALESLPPRQQQLIHCYYVEDLTMREVALIFGVGTARISQLHAKALSKLRAFLSEQYNTPKPKTPSMFPPVSEPAQNHMRHA